MNIEFCRFQSDDKELMASAMQIRTRVFVDEQGVDPTLEYDAHDTESTHYLGYFGGSVVATARWRQTEKGIKLERFAVLPDHRNSGIGADLLKYVLADLSGKSKLIYLHAQERAVSFYLRQGFVIEGEAFTEAGIRHFFMKLP